MPSDGVRTEPRQPGTCGAAWTSYCPTARQSRRRRKPPSERNGKTLGVGQLRGFGQVRVHAVPRLRTGSVDVHRGTVDARIVEAAGANRHHLGADAGPAEERRSAVATE